MAEPYIPFYPADYLADTMHLTLEEHGAYLKLLMVLWRAGGVLPDDDKKICQILGVTPKKWRDLKENIRSFFVYEEGKFYQKRLLADHRATTKKIEQNKKAGSKGGNAKSLKNKNPPLANAKISLDENPSEALPSRAVLRTPEPDIPSEDKSSSGNPLPLFPPWLPLAEWEAFKAMRNKIRRPMTLHAEKLAISKLEKFRANGHDPTEILNHSILSGYPGLYEPKEEIYAKAICYNDKYGSSRSKTGESLAALYEAGNRVIKRRGMESPAGEGTALIPGLPAGDANGAYPPECTFEGGGAAGDYGLPGKTDVALPDDQHE